MSDEVGEREKFGNTFVSEERDEKFGERDEKDEEREEKLGERDGDENVEEPGEER